MSDDRPTVTDNARARLTQAIKAVTDTWDEPLDDVHDIPPIVNAVLAEWAAGRAETATEDAARATDSNPDRMERAPRAVAWPCPTIEALR